MKRRWNQILTISALSLAAVACGSDDDDAGGNSGASDETKAAVVSQYASVVYATYSDALATAQALHDAIDVFLADPSEANLTAAKTAWKASRVPYGQSEVFRFYAGPIDNEESGPEGQLNAWPMDEFYVDYVEGMADAGIINNAANFPDITLDLIKSANENGAEENISTGYHAIEFLLWGQDMDPAGPGARPATDYTAGEGNNDRRRLYLELVTDLLISDLEGLKAAWAPDADNYRASFVSKGADAALTDILTGMGSLSGAELAGERMFVAWEEKDQEDEHSCFSDNTHVDIIENARGIQNVYLGRYGNVSGPGIKDLVVEVNPELAAKLETALAASVASAENIPVPFDQAILGDDSADGRVKVKATIDLLRAQTTDIADAATALGITINLEE
ncbi:MAG: imelysin family protein [Bradymonadia bacterium]